MEIYAAGEPRYVGAIPPREPLFVQSSPTVGVGWYVYETIAPIVFNPRSVERSWRMWRAILQLHWMRFRNFITKRLEE